MEPSSTFMRPCSIVVSCKVYLKNAFNHIKGCLGKRYAKSVMFILYFSCLFTTPLTVNATRTGGSVTASVRHDLLNKSWSMLHDVVVIFLSINVRFNFVLLIRFSISCDVWISYSIEGNVDTSERRIMTRAILWLSSLRWRSRRMRMLRRSCSQ